MVKKRGNVYFARWHVPIDLQPVMGKKEIVRTLKTNSFIHALQREGSISENIVFLWAEVRKRMSKKRLSDAEIRKLVDSNLGELLSACEQQRSEGIKIIDGFYNPSPQNSPELIASRNMLSTLLELFRDGLPLAHHDDELRQHAHHELANISLSTDDIEPASFNKLLYELGKARIRLFETELARLKGDYNNPYDSGVYNRPIEITVPDAPTLSDVIDEWLKASSVNCKASTLKDYETYKRAALKLLPNVPVNMLEESHFIDAIQGLGKGKSRHGKPFSRRSIEKYSTAFSIIMNYAVKKKYIASSPVPSIKKKAPAGNDSAWKPFKSQKQVRAIFDLPDLKAHKHSETYTLIWKILAYSGMRINEVVTLEASDIQEIDGVLCFKLRGEVTKSHKPRSVPVHSAIHRDVLNLVDKAGGGRLFDGFGSDAVSKALMRILKTLPDYSGQKNHSLRKFAVSSMQDADVEGDKIAALVGHDLALGITRMYAGEFKIKQLSEAIETIKL